VLKPSKYQKIYPLKNIIEPHFVEVYQNHLYISDKNVVKIFSMKGFTYQGNIGRVGEGPGEYIDIPEFKINPEYILITSTNKILYYKHSGEFIREKRFTKIGCIKPIKDNFVNFSFKRIRGSILVCYNLMDSDFKLIKRLHCGQSLFRKNRKRNLFEIFFYDTYKGKIILAHREGFVIDIFDPMGNLINSIQRKYKQVPFTDKDKEDVIKYLEYSPSYKLSKDYFKKATIFPEYYPPILTCNVDDDKIYITTYIKNKNNENKIIIYRLDGKYLYDKFVPIVMQAPHIRFPFTIFKKHLYQIVDNADEEIWELHITKIE
jgi:hypothetical protein